MFDDEYRTQATLRRGRTGGSTVRVFATQRALDHTRGGNIGPGTWEHALGSARAAWHCARGLAIDDYLRNVYPERYEGFYIDGFTP